MAVQSAEQIETSVLELCSEDDWGSWELWWNISSDVLTDQKAQLRKRFLDVVSELITDGKLIAKAHVSDGNIEPTQFDPEKLAREVDSANNPDPASFFWFGTN